MTKRRQTSNGHSEYPHPHHEAKHGRHRRYGSASNQPVHIAGVAGRVDIVSAAQYQQVQQWEEEMTNSFVRLAAINVGEHIEKKNGLSYLSWAWAVDQLLRNDPSANWHYGEPVRFGETMMVSCTVSAFGVDRTMQLPVMDHRNKAIANPDAFAVNTAMQRCLVKAIALHGIGLYIYAGEDVPSEDRQALNDAQQIRVQELRDAAINGTDALRVAWTGLSKAERESLSSELNALKAAATAADATAKAAA